MAIVIETAFLTSSLTGQYLSSSVPTENDVIETIASYKTADVAKSVEVFRKGMPPPVSDIALRKRIIDNLPDYVPKLRIDDTALTEKIKKLIGPILKIYGRDNVYEIIVIDHDTPLVMSDSGVVLVITTGTFIEVANDDELLGFIAHEVGHEYFGVYSVYLKYLIQKVGERGRETALLQNLTRMLAIIELQCDAFAAITLAFAGYDPSIFVDALERFAGKFKDHPMAWHPPESIRRKVALGVVPLDPTILRRKPEASSLLGEIRSNILALRRFKLLPLNANNPAK